MNRVTSLLLAGIAVFLVFATLTADHGLLHLLQIHNEVHTLKKNNRDMQSDMEDLSRSIRELEKNDFVLERTARQELGLSRKGEIVYIFPHSDRDDMYGVE